MNGLSKETTSLHMQNLVAQEMPLHGIHLIEASAGTGKTYNITRIYLRLLLEKKLSVQQILVMTFTKDATEEIRGRIDEFLRQALHEWTTLCEHDPFFKKISEVTPESDAKMLIRKALLYLDEASIFTIHGFCKQVLTEHAFACDVSFNAIMETDQQKLILEATQDWYRQLASADTASFNLISQFWTVPESMISHFSKAIHQSCPLVVTDKGDLINHFVRIVEQSLSVLKANEAFLFDVLVETKKGKDKEKRIEEYQQLISWLKATAENHLYVENKIPDAFIDGRRYSRSKEKEALVNIFESVNGVKQQAKTLLQEALRLDALVVIKQGIIAVRKAVNAKKQQLNILTFDDLIATLAENLKVPKQNELSQKFVSDEVQPSQNLLAQTLKKQFPFALVDEFQDTDPEQYEILKAIYQQNVKTGFDHQPTLNSNNSDVEEHESCGVMMIGDPKQAIYGFRGGDVFTYMSARKHCDYQWVMDTNWRSSCEVINGYNRLFYGTALNGEGKDVFGYNIPYHPVKASPIALKKKETLGLSQHQSGVHIVHFENASQTGTTKQSFRREMATWCANKIIELLGRHIEKSAHQQEGDECESQVNAKDIALLVRDGTEALEIKQALLNAGLSSVYLSNRTNLLHSDQTSQLLILLKGILFLENERLFSAALTSQLLPYHPEAYYQLKQNDSAWQALKVAFNALRQEWFHKGFITMALKLMHEHMVIKGHDSERIITNLLHLFELLQNASQRHKQPQELLHWLEQQSKAEFPESENELRLESEDNLIRIITQHGSKGLEYPIVFIPFATRHKHPLKFGNKAVQLIEYHDENGDLVVSLSGGKDAKLAMSNEAYAESIRLLYVAITRAEQQCYILSTPFEAAHLSPLGLVCGWQKDTDINTSLKHLMLENNDTAQVNNGIQVSFIDNEIEPLVYKEASKHQLLGAVSTFKGAIERDWWLNSFTALSRNLKGSGVSTPDRDNENLALDSQNLTSYQHLLRFSLTKGAQTGTFLHDIFEHLNFSQPDWQASAKWPLIKYEHFPSGFTESDLFAWLEEVLETPLVNESMASFHAETVAPFSLASIATDQCLKEAEFYFPLQEASVLALTDVLIEHRKNSPYQLPKSVFVELPQLTHLKGMMHGFVDLFFCHQGKYYVADYKSNFLGNDFSFYDVDSLQVDVIHHNYDLQYLIYSLALHRHLSVNLPDYDPERDFGGVYYLYLRGMTNDPNFKSKGVFYRKISGKELMALDSIFKGQYNDQ